jgi:hypothetical protein
MELNAISFDAAGRLDLLQHGVDKKAHGNSRLVKDEDHVFEALTLALYVQASLGSQLFAPLGNESDKVGLDVHG